MPPVWIFLSADTTILSLLETAGGFAAEGLPIVLSIRNDLPQCASFVAIARAVGWTRVSDADSQRLKEIYSPAMGAWADPAESTLLAFDSGRALTASLHLEKRCCSLMA